MKRQYDNLSSMIYEDLKLKIEEFKYKPEERISEASLASTYNVSRTPIKHCLARLENEELIYVRPQIGTFISKIDTKHVHEFFTIRMLLEVSILDEVIELNSKALIKNLQQNIAAQHNLVDEANQNEELDVARIFWKLDNAFHKIIFESVNKGYIWDFILSQSSQFNRFRLLTVSKDIPYLNDKITEHTAILDFLSGKTDINPKELYNNHLFATLALTTNELKEKYPDYFE